MVLCFFVLLSLNGRAQQPYVEIGPKGSISTFATSSTFAETNNYYYFLTLHEFDSTNNSYSLAYLFQADKVGNLKDSVQIQIGANSDSGFIFYLTQNMNSIEVVGVHNKYDTSIFGDTLEFKRIRFNEQLQVLSRDSLVHGFSTLLSPAFHRSYFGDHYFLLVAHIPTLPPGSGRVIRIDSSFQFVFEKSMDNQDKEMHDICVLFPGTILSKYVGAYGRVVKLNYNLDTINSYSSLFSSGSRNMSLQARSNSTFYFAHVNDTAIGTPDFISIKLADTNGVVLKQTNIGRAPSINNVFTTAVSPYSFTALNNSVYVGVDWYANSSVTSTSYFSLHRLDSNLNLKWSRLYGGDLPYLIYYHWATQDGGYFLMGSRRQGNNSTDLVEPIIFKVDSIGTITNVISFEPEVDYFTIYPNPSAGQFNIKNSSENSYEFMLWDSKGRLVFSKREISDKDFKLDLSEFSDGLYFGKFFTANHRTQNIQFLKRE